MDITNTGIVGHTKTLELIFSAHSKGRLGHSLLLVGPSGIGKRLVAQWIAKLLNCENQSCGQCDECQRIVSNNSTNVLNIVTEGQQIKVDDVSEVFRFIRLDSDRGHRVIVISDAQRLNPQAANRLLKSVEEPPPNTTFIMTTSNLSAVLPTIVSRSHQFLMSPLSVEDIQKIKPSPLELVRLAGGQLDRLELLSQESGGDVVKTAQAFWSTKGLAVTQEFEDCVKDASNARLIIFLWKQVIKMALKKQSLEPGWEKITSTPRSLLHELNLKMLQCERDLKGNIDKSVIFNKLKKDFREMHQYA